MNRIMRLHWLSFLIFNFCFNFFNNISVIRITVTLHSLNNWGWKELLHERRKTALPILYFQWVGKKNRSLEVNEPCSFEHIQMQKDWAKNWPVFFRRCTTLWMQFSWLQQEKTKFRCHIQSRNFVECLKPYYPRDFKWGKCPFLICYISSPLPLLQKFKIQMVVPILFHASFCLREGKHKAVDQPHSTNTT